MTLRSQLKRVWRATRTLCATAIMQLSLTLASYSGNPGETTSEDNHAEPTQRPITAITSHARISAAKNFST